MSLPWPSGHPTEPGDLGAQGVEVASDDDHAGQGLQQLMQRLELTDPFAPQLTWVEIATSPSRTCSGLDALGATFIFTAATVERAIGDAQG